jgi:hypothetical protein
MKQKILNSLTVFCLVLWLIISLAISYELARGLFYVVYPQEGYTETAAMTIVLGPFLLTGILICLAMAWSEKKILSGKNEKTLNVLTYFYGILLTFLIITLSYFAFQSSAPVSLLSCLTDPFIAAALFLLSLGTVKNLFIANDTHPS